MKKLLKRKAPDPPKRLRKSNRLPDPPAPPPTKTLKKLKQNHQRPKSGPIPEVPAKFKWKGKKDPLGKQYLAVQPEDMPDNFPKLHPQSAPNAYYRVNTDLNRLSAIVTVLPDGVHMAWDLCPVCMNHVSRCICASGVINPRSVEWGYIMAVLRDEGIEIHYPMDSTGHEVTSRGLYWYHGKETGRVVSKAGYTPVGTRGHAGSGRPSERPSVAPKRLLKKQRAPRERVDVSSLDMDKLNKGAATKSKDLVDAFEKSFSKPKQLKKPNTKRLKKG